MSGEVAQSTDHGKEGLGVAHDADASRLEFASYFHHNGSMQTKAAISALSALAQVSRLAIFRHLVEAGPDGAFAGRIAEHLGIPAATLSFHVKALSHAGLVHRETTGTFVRYTANFDAMNALVDYLTRNCCGGQPEKCKTECRRPATKRVRRKIAA